VKVVAEATQERRLAVGTALATAMVAMEATMNTRCLLSRTGLLEPPQPATGRARDSGRTNGQADAVIPQIGDVTGAGSEGVTIDTVSVIARWHGVGMRVAHHHRTTSAAEEGDYMVPSWRGLFRAPFDATGIGERVPQ